MKPRIAFFSLVLWILVPAVSGAHYHLDAADGNDLNAGTSPNEAWKSLEKVNATTFSPGDVIAFRRSG